MLHLEKLFTAGNEKPFWGYNCQCPGCLSPCNTITDRRNVKIMNRRRIENLATIFICVIFMIGVFIVKHFS